ncbi:cobalt-precorrin-6A reductase [Pseudomonas sp. Marseille-QA0892]
MTGRTLLLGGVADALWLARHLGPDDVYSLAGLGRIPEGLPCQVRIGGFGGADGLAAYLRGAEIDLVIDATHPYAARISANAVLASNVVGIPCWSLRRPAWERVDGDNWIDVNDWDGIIGALEPFERPLFTIGREPLAHLNTIPPHQHWTVRLLDPQPEAHRVSFIATRGPFHVEDERALFESAQFDVVVSKNSGGEATAAKLAVAREMSLPVIMVRRPSIISPTRAFYTREALLENLPQRVL